MAWIATAVLGGAAVSAAANIYGANQASNAIQNSANQAAQTQMQMYQQTQRYLAPYRQAGQADLSTLQSELPFLTSPIKMDQADLEQTPGYQFARTQGLKAVQNSAAARGLGESGAALKGAATFATGLADQTYQTQFNLENVNRSNAYNRLMGLVGAGQSAAAGTGAAAQTAGQGVAASQMAAGNAQAAAYNSLGSAGNTLANSLPVAAYAANRGLYGGVGSPVPGYNPGPNSAWPVA